MKEVSEETRRKVREALQRYWAGLSTEEKALRAMRQSVAARRKWASRTVAERKAIGKRISQKKQEKIAARWEAIDESN